MMGYVGLSVNDVGKFILHKNSQVWRFPILLMLSRLRCNSYEIFMYFSLPNLLCLFLKFIFFLNLVINESEIYDHR